MLVSSFAASSAAWLIEAASSSTQLDPNRQNDKFTSFYKLKSGKINYFYRHSFKRNQLIE